MFVIYKSTNYSFIRSSLKFEQIDGLLDTISRIKQRNQQNDKVLADVLSSVIYNLINDTVKTKGIYFTQYSTP